MTAAVLIGLMNACGPSEEEIRQREQARQDSLEQVRQDSLEQVRQDSIEQARQDSLAEAREAERRRNMVQFSEDGRWSVQVEAWRSEDKAQAQISTWRERGYENAYVIRHGNEATGDIWFRVRLGRLPELEMARNLQDRLMEEYGAESWITDLQSGAES
ncbi:MAG: SPOR domain-containing protein [Balneolaceae bacterium]|nr:SPOR domain-containing protein [Balneolaceae bacterium]